MTKQPRYPLDVRMFSRPPYETGEIYTTGKQPAPQFIKSCILPQNSRLQFSSGLSKWTALIKDDNDTQ